LNRETKIIIIIFILGFFLRLISLDKIPSEINRDEAAIGYNAYSLLKTGRDEFGKGLWPLVFRSFGDYKLPGYIYLTAPLIKIFGLNAYSVRLPAAFFGSLTIIIVYLLAKEIFSQKKEIPLIVSLVLAFAPFHLHYSRQAYEATVALFFSLTSIFLVIKSRKNKIFLLLSLPFMLTAFFIYNSPLFILPFLSFWTILIYKDEFLKDKKVKLIIFLFLFLLSLTIIITANILKEANKGKTNTTIFNQKEVEEQINRNIFFLNKKGFPIIVARIFYNKPFYWLLEYSKNYLAVFNPKFIFIASDNNYWHSLGYLDFGNILLVFLPFILLGIFEIIKNLNKKEYLWLLGYFGISGIINGFTIDSPILSRLLDFHIALVLISSLGLSFFWHWGRHWQADKYRVKNMSTLLLIIFFITNYLLTYFFVFPEDSPSFWLPGIKEVCRQIKQQEKEYDLVFFDAETDGSYIFLAFYLPFEPYNFQRQSNRTMRGFDMVTDFGKFIFDRNILNFKIKEYAEKFPDKNINILVAKRLNKESFIATNKEEVLIVDKLGRALWKLSKLSSLEIK